MYFLCVGLKCTKLVNLEQAEAQKITDEKDFEDILSRLQPIEYRRYMRLLELV